MVHIRGGLGEDRRHEKMMCERSQGQSKAPRNL